MSTQFAVLASGSRGNSTLVRGAGPGLLIDAGHRAAGAGETAGERRRGLVDVAAVVLTHTHGDHIDSGTFAELARRGSAFHCHEGHRAGTGRRPRLPADGGGRPGLLLRGDRPFLTATGVRLEPITLRHDGGPTFGFRIEASAGRRGRPVSIGYLADTGSWSERMADVLADVDVLGVEFNHDVAMQKNVRPAVGPDPAQPGRPRASLQPAGRRSWSRRSSSDRDAGPCNTWSSCTSASSATSRRLAIEAARSAVRAAGRRVVVHAAQQDARPIPTSGSGRDAGAGRAVASRREAPASLDRPASNVGGPGPRRPVRRSRSGRRPGGRTLTVAHYFASDVHLRDDHPERDDRFRSWVGGLTAADSLVIVGDLCDFWMGARVPERRLASCPSLRALAEFRRRGGSLAIMAGQPRPVALPVLRASPRRRDPRGARRSGRVRAAGPDGPRPSPGRPAALEGRRWRATPSSALRLAARTDRPAARPGPHLEERAGTARRRGTPPARVPGLMRPPAATPPTSSSSAMCTARSTRPARPATDRPRRMAAPLELPEDRRGRGELHVFPATSVREKPIPAAVETIVSPASGECSDDVTTLAGPTLMKFDHHLHTARHSPDSSSTPWTWSSAPARSAWTAW